MANQMERLEERVAAAVALIAHLRSEVARLQAFDCRPAAAPEPGTPGLPETAAEDLRALREEVARLNAERAVVRDRVRSLIREIDAVTW